MVQDHARGLQTIRHNSERSNIAPKRIGCFGSSADAGISLWLAFHDALAALEDTPNMYVSKKFDEGARLSEVDLHNWDEAKFPLFSRVKHQKIILHAGQMLFIPRGWWHHVESMDKSISVSNLTYDLKGILLDAIPHRVKQILHNVGLWKCDCTCHVWRNGKWVRK
ncbi:MAG: cupin-like domain-containing protein [Planctomycetota bacterium]|nr:cupin-like domain-containing protein [Planctomycetota bacterium]